MAHEAYLPPLASIIFQLFQVVTFANYHNFLVIIKQTIQLIIIICFFNQTDHIYIEDATIILRKKNDNITWWNFLKVNLSPG